MNATVSIHVHVLILLLINVSVNNKICCFESLSRHLIFSLYIIFIYLLSFI